MKKLMTIVLGMMVAVGMAGMAIAGSIDSPGPPSSGSGMYTLQQVYNYLSAGTTATIPGSFQEPSAGPGSTMKTTTEIVAAVATPFAQANATAADVKSGVTFFSTKASGWGVRSGDAAGTEWGEWVVQTEDVDRTATTNGIVHVYNADADNRFGLHIYMGPTSGTMTDWGHACYGYGVTHYEAHVKKGWHYKVAHDPEYERPSPAGNWVKWLPM